ncbi:MAG: mechanosensitive ion channel family protein [Chloroflexi bacterium]|mgnify:CR=1 FL=1|nr:mechanosensitive ion channel family protein [Chloroflexota bacterium]MBK6708970.1 mechanosensitive ion channel family protein [Chloroflexota bacterium]MBK7175865.1 mechanosensitive ion channel family protein [Chloroflexota bacterium]MBK7914750.1 mechanosensitive ion channel family protein [Chloroflexota bacterium]MBK8934420.1 mechanosensitive ion channel family protein [Chloroflexota bacterium]
MTQIFDRLQQWFLVHGLTILVILLLSVAGYYLLEAVVRFMGRQIKGLDSEAGGGFDKRTETISKVVHSAGLAAIVATAVVMILQEVGVPIAPLLASVGVVGLALGLGAQTLVKDVISGVFILLENQYMIEDVIQVNAIVGNVEEMTLRTTAVRDSTGTLFMIPNGEIRIVANRSRDWSRAIVDVGIAYEANVDRALAVLQTSGETLAHDEEMSDLLLESPQVTGIEGLDEWAVRLRLMVKTKPNKQWEVQRFLRRQIRLDFAAEGIEMAFSRREVAVLRAERDKSE